MIDYFINIAKEYKDYSYIVIFLAAYFENIFPPIPGDTLVVLSAFWVISSKFSIFGAILSSVIGSFLGFLTYYFLAYKYGEDFFKWKITKNLKNDTLFQKFEEYFKKYGYVLIAFNRFFSGFRSIISIAAGFYRLSPLKVSFYSFISCLLWNSLIIYSIFLFKSNINRLIRIISKYNAYTFISIIIILILFFLGYFLRRKVKRNG